MNSFLCAFYVEALVIFEVFCGLVANMIEDLAALFATGVALHWVKETFLARLFFFKE
jgi:hypothetical protein